MSRLSRAGLLLAGAPAGLLLAQSADVSQGPGIAPGTAGAFTQTAMAIIVYGASAAIIAAGLIGVLK